MPFGKGSYDYYANILNPFTPGGRKIKKSCPIVPIDVTAMVLFGGKYTEFWKNIWWADAYQEDQLTMFTILWGGTAKIAHHLASVARELSVEWLGL